MFIKKLASRILARPQAPELVAAVAAFGKHPAWDDHIDDIGLQTDLLISAKRVLYVEGIGGNIDAGAWEGLPSDHALTGFDHSFVWRMRDDTIVGRLWSSSDGKGRTSYPMVVCAHFSVLPAPPVIRAIAPLLEQTREDLVQAATQAQVMAAMERAASDIGALVQAIGREATVESAHRNAAARLATSPEMGPDAMGLMRVLYCIERELSAYQPLSGSSSRTHRVNIRAQGLRVPACATDGAEAACLWLDFLSGELVPTAPVWLIRPWAQRWVDVIVGDPDKTHFFCLRASEKSIPLVTEIPYTLEQTFLDQARKALPSTSS